MNKVFKVIWNSQLQLYIVASELAKGVCRSTTRSSSEESSANPQLPAMVATIALSTFCVPLSNAAEMSVYAFDPTDPTEIHVNGTGNNLTGSYAVIKRGSGGYKRLTLGEAKEAGLLGTNSDLVGKYDLLKMGSQIKSINYIDPHTGANLSMKVYDSDAFYQASLTDFVINASTPVGPTGQYIDRNLYTVGKDSALDVNVGSLSTNWMNNVENNFSALMKSSDKNKNNSSAFFVSSDDGKATLNYNSKSIIQLGNNNNNFKGSTTPIAWAVLDKYTGTFDSLIGTQTVTNIEEFVAYNNALIQALQKGDIKLTEAQYSAELNKARDTIPYPIYTNESAIGNDDAVRANINKNSVSFIHGNGKDAAINIGSDANLQLLWSDATLVNLENGASLVNNGTLGTVNNTLQGAYVVAVRSGSSFVNNGVIDAGTNDEMRLLDGSSDQYVMGGQQTGIMANGASAIHNTQSGIINLATSSSQNSNDAVQLNDDSVMTNDGVINVSSTRQFSTQGTPVTTGVKLSQRSSFTNNGLIYIGREAQREATDDVADLAIPSKSVGVQITDNAGFINADTSKIVIGSLASDATAIKVSSTASTSPVVNQKGTIEVNGIVNGTTAANTGIAVSSGTTLDSVVNSGTIDLNGIYGIGIDVTDGGMATHSGVINVNGGMDPVSKYSNYGIRTEGDGSVASVSGSINLKGDNAIGVYVQNKGLIALTGTGEVNFSTGNHQTGYYIYGSGSSVVNNSDSIQNVSTTDSTLYRIDGGATYSGSASSQSQLVASGEGSTIVRTTGAGSIFNSGSFNFSVTGENATAVSVEGGASGTISSDTSITLSGRNTTAGIVDGDYYSLDGTINETLSGNSLLTTNAILDSANSAAGVSGYIARNGGHLIHNGSINFTSDNSTGIYVDGGILENNSKIEVNGVAVNIQGENSTVTNTGTVTATDGTAAFLVGNNASLVLDGKGETHAAGTAHGILIDTGAIGLEVNNATINMASTGTGSAIENKGAVDGLQLINTTLNVGNGIGIHTGASLASTNSGSINISGSGTGILFENVADGSDTDNVLDISDSRDLFINVNSAQGTGIVTRASTDLKTGASVNVLNSEGNSALVIEGTTKNVEQSGILTSVSENSPVVKIVTTALESFTNKGTISALDSAHKAIETLTGKGLTFINATGANIIGQLNLLSGDNTIILESGSSATDITSGSGSDSFILKNITHDQSDSIFTSLNGGEGEDKLTLQNSAYTLNQPNRINNIEHVLLTENSVLTLNNTSLAQGDDGANGEGTGFQIDETSKLNIEHGTGLVFDNHLSGTGVLAVNTSGHDFSFDTNNASDGFAGMVELTDSQFELGGVNTIALSAATLRVGEKSHVQVSSGEQRIGQLAFAGGSVHFDGVTPGNASASGIITADKLDLLGRGDIVVDPGTVDNLNPALNTHRPLLEQDDGQALIKLASADTSVTGGAGNLNLKDKNGNTITDSMTIDITQNDSTVAKGTFDYRLSSGDNDDGLYVSYGLTQVELLGKNNDTLILDAAGKTGNAADLSAKIIGSGDIAFNSAKGESVTLSNMDNHYSGMTDIRSGNLSMLNNNVLGNTRELKLAADTEFNMNGYSQTIGTLNTSQGSEIQLNGGQLTLLEGGVSSGELTGDGQLNIDGGTLIVSGDNVRLNSKTTISQSAIALLDNTLGLGKGEIVTAGILELSKAAGTLYNSLSDAGNVLLSSSQIALSGDNSAFKGLFDIDSASSLTASSASQLGSAEVNNEGTFVLNANNDWSLTNLVQGSGNVSKEGTGIIALNDSAQWTGSTDINAGGITLGTSEKAFVLNSNKVTVHQQASLSGFGGVTGNLVNNGTLVIGSTHDTTSQNTSTFNVGGDLSNSGVIALGSPGHSAGHQLVINGDYTGNGGQINLNTALGSDDSLTDKMIVNGSTSGTTRVSVQNAGGTGAKTLNGIQIIQVNGQSQGDFTQASRIVAGAYDYTLARGQGESNGSWYLTNTSSQPTPPPSPTPEPTPEPEPTPAPDVRPEGGSYTANMAAANTMFATRLHDRLGETQYIDALTGEEKVTSMWLRQVGGHTNSRDGSGQLKTQSNRYVIQLGGDVAQWSTDGLDRLHLGAMAGYGHNSSNTRSDVTNYSSDGSINGYSVGLYGTWYANDDSHQGTYLDSWIQYNWFKNSVSGEGLSTESYKSKGITSSIEAGYTHKLGEFTGSAGSTNEWFIQPQAQAIWMGVKSHDFNESNGTNISIKGDGNIQTRLGVRTFLKGHSAIDNGKQREFEPFIETNWIHNSRDFGTQMDGVTVKQSGAKNIAEMKTGVEGKISPTVNIWGNVGVQVGDNGYSDASATIGFKYNF